MKYKCSWLFVLIAALTILFIAYNAFLQLGGNFHEVVQGEVYRSAQPSGKDISEYAKELGIRSILNLRGENHGQAWYETEVNMAKKYHTHLINFPISSKRVLSLEDTQTLIALMKKAPKPLLIHCAGGANRTGLASALYLASIKKKGTFESKLQLSPLYGHLPFRFLGAPAMDETFASIEALLDHPNKQIY